MNTLPKSLKFLASLKIAVFIILGLAVISGVGTIVEARYDAEIAQKLVYHSIYMKAIILLLCTTLIAVMVDRLPWKQHHAGFVLAHIGIIILFVGSWMTQKYGIDGTMVFGIGESRRNITVREQVLNVYSSFDGTNYRNLYAKPVDFISNPPTEKEPFVIQLGSEKIEIIQYEHFSFRESEIKVSELENDGPAIRFQLENPNVNMTQWLRRESRRDSAEIDLGPAKVIIASSLPKPAGRNSVILVTKPGQEIMDFVIYNKDNSIRKSGKIKQGETIDTGWMGMQFRLLRYLPHSKEVVTYRPSPTASPISSPSAKFRFNGEEYWIGMNSNLRLYQPDKMYVLTFGNKQLELLFPLKLLEFKIGHYEGTTRAASYESIVEVPDIGLVTISMNEPLKYAGFTFYQSSFEKNEQGEPVASILSVNYDPGRWVKYAGSLLMVLGSVVLFYFRRVKWLTSLKNIGSGS